MKIENFLKLSYVGYHHKTIMAHRKKSIPRIVKWFLRSLHEHFKVNSIFVIYLWPFAIVHCISKQTSLLSQFTIKSITTCIYLLTQSKHLLKVVALPVQSISLQRHSKIQLGRELGKIQIYKELFRRIFLLQSPKKLYKQIQLISLLIFLVISKQHGTSFTSKTFTHMFSPDKIIVINITGLNIF